jgi:radical SAM superfamily enzyme YgiQ (UPF0313 family)
LNILLISTYELGRQPFGLASPAAWLERAGAQVECLDLSRQALDEARVRAADAIALYVPMHTATRMAVEVLPRIRALNPEAKLCFYGLYAPVNEPYLRQLGAEMILGGEFEAGLVAWVNQLENDRSQPESAVSLERLQFIVPERSGLPKLSRYAHLILPNGDQRVTGYTEASRGCKHLCRHCPIVPVYHGAFRVVQPQVVLEDIRRQVAAGAEHITFGDPDFFNGIRHAVEIVNSLHREFPCLTYDVTIKIEHLLQYSEHLRTLRETGCLFVTSAVESVDDEVLRRLDKGHARADFVAVVELFRESGLTLSPTFVAFTPWTTLASYIELLGAIAELGLIEHVAPIQLAIRLLIPNGSRLLELPEVQELVAPFDKAALVFPWGNPDPRMDELCLELQEIVREGEKNRESRGAIFENIWRAAHRKASLSARALPATEELVSRATIPYLTEPWYC